MVWVCIRNEGFKEKTLHIKELTAGALALALVLALAATS